MEKRAKNKIDEAFAQGTPIDDALRQAVREALLRHKQARNPICEWQDGKVAWIPFDEIDCELPNES